MPITLEQIEKISTELKELPPIENRQQQVSKQEAVKRLANDINDLQKRGYTLEQIADLLKSKGLDIGTKTLKSYLQRARPAKKADVAATRRKTPIPEAAVVEKAQLPVTESHA